LRWCGERGIDPEWWAGFAEGARYQAPRSQEAIMLSLDDVARLLGFIKRDESPLGRRDYAFILARLRLGAPLKALQRLRWGQIEVDEAGAWIRWRAGAEPLRLDDEVWEAIRAALAAGGRLEGIGAQDHVFAPLREPGVAQAGGRAQDWEAGRYLTTGQLLANLKLYGRAAGIEEDRLNLVALRRTATRLKMDQGASLEEMRGFLACREDQRFASYRLRVLPQLPAGEAGREAGEVALPNRMAKPFQEGEGTKHGLYARRQPRDQVEALLRENIEGIAEEMAGMRSLGRGLLELEGLAQSGVEAVQIGEAYTLNAARLAAMMEAEKHLQKDEEARWAEEAMARLGAMAQGAEAQGAEALGAEAGASPEMEEISSGLSEEIAATRYVLRNTLRRARQAGEKGDIKEYIHLAEIYSTGCSRLMKLLKVEKEGGGRLAAQFRQQIQQVVREVGEEWGLGRED
jgi:hypothetical protein